MRLYLSSFRVGSRPQELAAMATGDRVGVVFNARDGFGAQRDKTFPREIRDLETLGFKWREIDLRHHFRNRDQLAEDLHSVDMLWVVGGNAFVIARAAQLSGLGPAIRQRFAQDDLVYAGYSAGACLAGPDLEGIELIDPPDECPEGYPPPTSVRCLGLISQRVVPHWRSDHPETAAAERAVAHLRELGLAHQPLRDGMVITVKDGETTVN